MWFLEHAWLIFTIPAASFFLILAVGKRLPLKGAELAIAAMGTSFVLSLATAYQWIRRADDAAEGGGAFGALTAFGRSVLPHAEAGHEEAPFVSPVTRTFTWWQSGGQKFQVGTLIDGLSVTLLVVVSLITTLVLVYSIEYMKGDRRFTYFFAALTLFASGMLAMVSASNTLLFLLGWEIMGLCSFMLIGHWWEDAANSRAAMKAFLTVRTGDVGILIGFSILFFGANAWAIEHLDGSGFDIRAIQGWALSGQWSRAVIVSAAVALLWAAIGKSGQFPLHTWLPDAMAGPTPVSSLLHSSTMVVGGVFLIARFYPVFWEGFHIPDGGWNWVALVGGVTIIIAALLAFVQVDIKKVLAYSTVSQLGYMVMGLGVGAWTASVFHIFTHAWFKALLFLCAGSVSHSGSHHSFDMKTSMGGLRKHMPITFACWVVGTLALAGIFPLAGFWSKDEILANAGHGGYTAFMVVGLVGAFMTAAYMMRATYLTFFGEYRGDHAVHDDDTGPTEQYDEFLPDAELATVGGGHDHEGRYPTGLLASHEVSHPVDAGHDLAAAHDEGTTHDAGHGHDAGHDAGHGGGHGDHDEHHEPHESGKLITVPLIILAVLSIVAGFINAVAFDIEKFKEWVEPSSVVVEVEQLRAGQGDLEVALPAIPGDAVRLPAAETEPSGGSGAEPTDEATTEEGHGEEAARPEEGQGRIFPVVEHAPFKWSEALLSLAVAIIGFVVSFFVCASFYGQGRFAGLTQRSRALRAGYTFLWNKYYLDDLYEKLFVPAVSTVFARLSYWFNMKVLDSIVDGAGKGAVKTGEVLYGRVDQGVIDGIVNGAGSTAEGTGEALRPSQSGKVQQYGAYLFGAAALGGLVLVIATSL